MYYIGYMKIYSQPESVWKYYIILGVKKLDQALDLA